jgi:N-acetylmuramoyl-L-alanine amidase
MIMEKHRSAPRAVWGVFVLIVAPAWSALCAQPRLINEITGTEKPLAVSARGETACASLTDVFEGAGYSWKWDFTAEKLTCTKKGSRLVFVQGMPFYLVNDTLRQIPCEPERDGGMLFLPAALCAGILSAVTRDSVAWNDRDSAIVLRERTAAPPETKPAVRDTADVARAARAPDTTQRVKQPQQEIVKTVVVDPGHGGMDPGAIGPDGIEEKNVVLGIALAVRDLIKKKTKLTVYLTRETDTFIPLVDRTRFANDKKADIFVSIHANSIQGDKKKKDGTRGYKVYFLSQAKNEDDKLVAMRENAVIELEDKSHKYDNLQDILIDMAGNEFLRESQDLSIMITETFGSSASKIPRLHLGVGQANFWVLNGTYMPSVLIEVGFISSSQEEHELADAVTQKSIASGIFDAILKFKKKYEEGQ